jgi:ApbE superfamily uncharacterized protein (UPF0280 family)
MYHQLGPGKILLDYGPILMTIEASRQREPLTAAAIRGAETAVEELNALSSIQWKAKPPAHELSRDDSNPEVLNLMIAASQATGEPDITPMAAVAGSFAEKALERARQEGATRVIVNNGGDIALCMEPDSPPIRVGIVASLSDGRVTHYIDIRDEYGIGGIATSGFGGRSFTKGVASAVVALSSSSAQADACATIVANCTFTHHPDIVQVPAEILDPLTDIIGHRVTASVGKLDKESIEKAIKSGQKKFFQYLEMGLLWGGIIFVQGSTWMFPKGIAQVANKLSPSITTSIVKKHPLYLNPEESKN